MKINRIKDFESFFKVVDKCKGRVDIVSPEGDNIVLNSQLCRFVLTALVQSGDTLLDTLELHCENPDDAALFIIELPQRATKGSAGYDFYSPLSFVLEPGETIKIPTGIRCGMDNDWVLMLFPRSGLGFKYRIRLENTVGIIDSDYFYSDNEGHIMVKITNEGVKTMKVAKGDGFCQGIFLPYGITEDDKTEGTRNGGFGSTDK